MSNIKATARRYKIAPKQIRNWRGQIFDLRQKAVINPHAKTTGAGPVVEYFDLEEKLHKWIEELRLEDIPVRTNNIIAQAINLDETGQFKRGNAVCITRWVYHFLARWDLSIRRVARVGQKLSGHLQKIKDDTTASINKKFLPGHTMHGLDPHYFLNMDQTAVFFESKSKTCVAKKGSKTVSARDSGSDSKRCTVVVTVAADGTKLPPFFIFKGQPGKTLEQQLRKANMAACCQENGWFDESVFQKWIDDIIEPYMRGADDGFLLVDQYKVHLMGSFVHA